MTVMMLSVQWALGATAAYDPMLHVFHGIVLAMGTIVAVSDVTLLRIAYLLSLALGANLTEAISVQRP